MPTEREPVVHWPQLIAAALIATLFVVGLVATRYFTASSEEAIPGCPSGQVDVIPGRGYACVNPEAIRKAACPFTWDLDCRRKA